MTWIERLVMGMARRWMSIFLLVIALFTALPVAAPLLEMAGRSREAAWIYLAYRATCHQLPHHSWFIGGPRAQYSWAEVRPYTGLAADEALKAFHRPLRHPELGYQLAFCQRDLAIWGSLLLAAAFLAWIRGRGRRPKPLALRWYLVALLPIAVDGLTQLVGLRQSSPSLRTITGAIFGAATAWLVIPLLDEGFGELESTEARTRAPQATGGPDPVGGPDVRYDETPGR